VARFHGIKAHLNKLIRVAQMFSHSSAKRYFAWRTGKGVSAMAMRGIGFFDAKGHYFKTPEEATLSDLASVLGRVGEGDSLAPGIAKTLLDKRHEIEKIFADHSDMERTVALGETGKVARLRSAS
jgi:hypothetical protein